MAIRDLDDARLAAAAEYMLASRTRRYHFFSVADTTRDGPGRANLARDLQGERDKRELGHRFPDLLDEEAVYCAGWGEMAALELSPIQNPREKDQALVRMLRQRAYGYRGRPRISGG